jgi:hypothetical protein
VTTAQFQYGLPLSHQALKFIISILNHESHALDYFSHLKSVFSSLFVIMLMLISLTNIKTKTYVNHKFNKKNGVWNGADSRVVDHGDGFPV